MEKAVERSWSSERVGVEMAEEAGERVEEGDEDSPIGDAAVEIGNDDDAGLSRWADSIATVSVSAAWTASTAAIVMSSVVPLTP